MARYAENFASLYRKALQPFKRLASVSEQSLTVQLLLCLPLLLLVGTIRAEFYASVNKLPNRIGNSYCRQGGHQQRNSGQQ